MEKLKRTKQIINAIVSFEIANMENEDFKKIMEPFYCVETKSGYFWGFNRKLQNELHEKLS